MFLLRYSHTWYISKSLPVFHISIQTLGWQIFSSHTVATMTEFYIRKRGAGPRGQNDLLLDSPNSLRCLSRRHMPSCHKADAAARCVAAVWMEVGCSNNLCKSFHANRLEARVSESLSVTSRCQERIWESSTEKEASWSLLIEPGWMWHGLAVSGHHALASVRDPRPKLRTCDLSRTSLTATFLSQVWLSGQMSLSLIFINVLFCQ